MPTLEYKQSVGVGPHAWGRVIRFPEYTRLLQLFSEWKPWRHHEGLSKRYPEVQGVSDYCSMHSTKAEHSLHVKARPELIAWINENMIRGDNDSWYFELIQRKDGMLVLVKNNQIIASRWLALLDVDQTLREIETMEI